MRGRIFPVIAILVSVAAAAAMVSTFDAPARAQSSKSKSKSKSSSSVKALDVRSARLQESFVRDAADLARDYEQAGQLEKAKSILEVVRKLNPDLPGVKEKIAELDETILSSNAFDVEVDASSGWGTPVGRVFKGRAFRLESVGEYQFVTSLTVGPEGFPTEDVTSDMAGGIRCGALMGLIVAGPGGKGKPKLGTPFKVGNTLQYTPKEDGLLFLRVNAPAGSKCTGKLDVHLSGYVLPQ